MPSTPTTPSNSKPSTAAAGTGSSSTPAKSPRTTAKKALNKPAETESTLVDKSVQKTTRNSAPKSKPKVKSTFEKPAEAEWHRMISEAAYYRAERRGFQAGHEHEDWSWAEEQVRKILSP